MRSSSKILMIVLWASLLVSLTQSATGGGFEKEFRLYDGEVEQGKRLRYMTAIVGDPGNVGNGPYVKFSLWQGECSLVIGLQNEFMPDGYDSLSDDGQVVSLSGSAVIHRFYPVPRGFEWETILSEKPDTNVFSHKIACQGLTFQYQDSLTEFEIDSLGAKRPDSVVGSWVAYHSSERHNRRVVSRGDTSRYNYGTGQAFVIYRPRAWDSSDTVWCELKIDTIRQQLNIMIDPIWLASADFPVTIDPTFGNTSVGTSTLDWNQSYAYCHNLTGTNTYTVPAGKTVTIEGYSVYGSETGAGGMDVQLAAFSISDGYPDSRVDQPATVVVSGGTPAWFSSPAVSHNLATSLEYGVAVGCAPRSGGTIYYNSVSNSSATDNTNCTLGAQTWIYATQTNFNFSMYATFVEEEASSEFTGGRRRDRHREKR